MTARATVTIATRYAALRPGMTAAVVADWYDPNGTRWLRLDFGAHRDGTRMRQVVPANVTDRDGRE